MSRSFLVVASIAIAGCTGGRQVDVDFFAPAECRPRQLGDAGRGEPIACPLSGIRAVETRVERDDSTIAERHCAALAPDACDYDALVGVLYVPRIIATGGLEITMRAWTEDDCTGTTLFQCDSFGDHSIDLRSDLRIAVWCNCPAITEP